MFLQVLSNSVAKALQITGGTEAQETVRFVGMFNKFFDCLNVRSLSEDKLQRCPFKSPYRSGMDFRLKVELVGQSMSFCAHVYKVCMLFVYIYSGWKRHSFPTYQSGNKVSAKGMASLRRTKCCWVRRSEMGCGSLVSIRQHGSAVYVGMVVAVCML